MKESKELYVTITGFKNYHGMSPLGIGKLVQCKKERDNVYDGEAIICTIPFIGTVGYIANSTNTVAGGTMSAGRVYDKVPKRFYVRVMFTTFTKVICRVEEDEPIKLKEEMLSQYEDDWDDDDDDDDEGEEN